MMNGRCCGISTYMGIKKQKNIHTQGKKKSARKSRCILKIKSERTNERERTNVADVVGCHHVWGANDL